MMTPGICHDIHTGIKTLKVRKLTERILNIRRMLYLKKAIGHHYLAAQKNLDTTQKKVLEYFKDNPKATRVDAANALGNITEDGVKFIIAKLQKKGLRWLVALVHWPHCQVHD
jgi:predicted HTH transcriptional regulator